MSLNFDVTNNQLPTSLMVASITSSTFLALLRNILFFLSFQMPHKMVCTKDSPNILHLMFTLCQNHEYNSYDTFSNITQYIPILDRK